MIPDALRPGYEILEEIGRGGMGVVYKARQLGVGRLVALKRLHAADPDPYHRIRFRREAEAAGRLTHPNIVQVYEVGEQDGVPYLALEYVEGKTLAQLLKCGPLEPRHAALMVETLALAIEHAHRAGVLHRDLKPGNILLSADPAIPHSPGTPKITDFGLARLSDSLSQTATGAVLGTPGYMAPEQVSGPVAAIGPAADIYGLGAILFAALTGRPPFRGETALQTIDQARSGPPPSPTSIVPATPAALAAICLRCLQAAPEKRYATAADLAADLRRFLEGKPVSAVVPRVRSGSKSARWILAVALFFAAAAAIWSGRDDSPGTANIPREALVLWLSADVGVDVDGSGYVERWSDASVRRLQAGQPRVEMRPQFVKQALNGRPVIRFDGLDDWLTLDGQVLSSQEFTAIAVVHDRRSAGDSHAREILSNWDREKFKDAFYLGTIIDRPRVLRLTDELAAPLALAPRTAGKGDSEAPGPLIATVVGSAADAVLYQGSQRLRSLGGPLPRRDLDVTWRIGTQGGDFEFWHGDIAEILVYERALPDAELTQVWGYLHRKYLPEAD
jgi:hypothetical protein